MTKNKKGIPYSITYLVFPHRSGSIEYQTNKQHMKKHKKTLFVNKEN